MFTTSSGYLAYRLKLAGGAEESLTQTISGAKIDMNPYKVDAVKFAFASPLSNGLILAGKVVLGKIIESSILMLQRCAERKRKFLLIVPTALSKQWRQELEKKLSLPSCIVEA